MEEIIVVVGYMKEKFFYLKQKYPGIHLIVNNEFGKKENLYTVCFACKHLDNTFICCADHYFTEKPFIYDNPESRSWRACVYETGKFQEFAVTVSNAGVITETSIGGQDSLAQVGCAYLNSSFSSRFRSCLEVEINDFSVSSIF